MLAYDIKMVYIIIMSQLRRS